MDKLSYLWHHKQTDGNIMHSHFLHHIMKSVWHDFY